MNILSYVRTLAPVMERRDLLKNIEQLQVEYDDTIAPILSDVEEVFLNFKPKSVLYKKLETSFRREYNTNVAILGLIYKSVRNVRDNLDTVRGEIRSLFSIQFTNANLTYNRVALLKYVEGIAFYIRFIRKFTLFLIGQEAALLGKATKQRWSGAEIDWVEGNINEFVSLYGSMAVTSKELKDRVNKTSSATVDEATHQLAEQAVGIHGLDGIDTSGFSPRHNPFLVLGRFIAEYQVDRYLSSQQELYGLQLRLEELRSLLGGDPSNPAIQKQIEAYENRISEYEYRIAKIEERANKI